MTETGWMNASGTRKQSVRYTIAGNGDNPCVKEAPAAVTLTMKAAVISKTSSTIMYRSCPLHCATGNQSE